MDDVRFEWLRDNVYCALEIQDPEVFEELLNREDGEYERALAKFLNETPEGGKSAAIFFKRLQEEEIEVKVEIEPSELDPTLEALNDENGEGGEGTDGVISALDGTLTEATVTPALAETPVEEEKGKKKKKKKGKKVSSAKVEEEPPKEEPKEQEEIKPEEGVDGVIAPSPERIPQMKNVKHTIEQTLLYMCTGTVPEEVCNNDCVYFLRNTPGMVELPNTLEEANHSLPQFFEFGVLNGSSLTMLEQVIMQVYIPLLSFNSHKNGEAPTTGEQQAALSSTSQEDMDDDDEDEELSQQKKLVESQHRAMLRDEFLINMQKFATHISRTIQQIEGEVRLDVPHLSLDGDIAELAKDDALVHKIKNACLEWTKQIASALEIQLKKTPQGDGPLAEIDQGVGDVPQPDAPVLARSPIVEPAPQGVG